MTEKSRKLELGVAPLRRPPAMIQRDRVERNVIGTIYTSAESPEQIRATTVSIEDQFVPDVFKKHLSRS